MRSILQQGIRVVLMMVAVAISVSAADLRTISGKTYVNYKVVKVLPDALQVSHESGVSNVPLSDVPPEIREQYAEQVAKAAEAMGKAKAKADARKANVPDPAETAAAAKQAAAERRERQADADAAKKERFQQLSVEAEPYFTVDRTTFMKEGGGFLYAARGVIIPVAGEAILVDGAVCTRARPELVPVDAYRLQAVGRLEELETMVNETIPGQIAKNEDRIRDLEKSITTLRAAADLADKPPPFEAAHKATEVRKLQRENKKLEKDKVAQLKLIAAAKAELAKIEQAIEKYAAQKAKSQ
jgi:hypothetical protein